jgi:hypothetical protein
MPEPTPEPDSEREEADFCDEYFVRGNYSVWDLGPLADPDPKVVARFEAIEKELTEMSENTAYRRTGQMHDSVEGNSEETREVVLQTELENHERRISLLKFVVHQIRTGVDF